jgi:hypothetical protein
MSFNSRRTDSGRRALSRVAGAIHCSCEKLDDNHLHVGWGPAAPFREAVRQLLHQE